MAEKFHSWVFILKKTNFKKYTHSNVHRSVIYKGQDTEATYVSLNR